MNLKKQRLKSNKIKENLNRSRRKFQDKRKDLKHVKFEIRMKCELKPGRTRKNPNKAKRNFIMLLITI